MTREEAKKRAGVMLAREYGGGTLPDPPLKGGSEIQYKNH